MSAPVDTEDTQFEMPPYYREADEDHDDDDDYRSWSFPTPVLRDTARTPTPTSTSTASTRRRKSSTPQVLHGSIDSTSATVNSDHLSRTDTSLTQQSRGKGTAGTRASFSGPVPSQVRAKPTPVRIHSAAAVGRHSVGGRAEPSQLRSSSSSMFVSKSGVPKTRPKEHGFGKDRTPSPPRRAESEGANRSFTLTDGGGASTCSARDSSCGSDSDCDMELSARGTRVSHAVAAASASTPSGRKTKDAQALLFVAERHLIAAQPRERQGSCVSGSISGGGGGGGGGDCQSYRSATAVGTARDSMDGWASDSVQGDPIPQPSAFQSKESRKRETAETRHTLHDKVAGSGSTAQLPPQLAGAGSTLAVAAAVHRHSLSLVLEPQSTTDEDLGSLMDQPSSVDANGGTMSSSRGGLAPSPMLTQRQLQTYTARTTSRGPSPSPAPTGATSGGHASFSLAVTAPVARKPVLAAMARPMLLAMERDPIKAKLEAAVTANIFRGGASSSNCTCGMRGECSIVS